MARVTVSFSGTEESSERCKQLFPEGKNESALTSLLDAFESNEKSSTALAQLEAELQSTQNELAQIKEESNQYRSIVEGICNTYTKEPQEILEFIGLQVKLVQEGIDENRRFGAENELLKSQISDQALTANQLLLNLPDAVLKMLHLTAERLTEKYQTTITPQDVLMKIFVRYTVERYTNWFYNFVLNDNDIEACSGKSISEWKAFIKGELK